MTTPPTNPPLPPPDRSGPAWTRNPKSSPKKHKSRPPPPGPGGAPYSNNAASSTSSISLLNPHASTSSLSLPQAQQPGEAPYLTHKHRYHGQLTLVAPDNLGARRQAGTVDAPETRIDARGGFGLPGMDEREGEDEGAARVEDDDERARKIKKKVKKKKKKEEEQARQRQIMQAVSNAGRTPSPTSNAPRQGQVATGANPGGPNEMARSSSGQAMLTVPTSGTQPRERRSRSRSRNRPTNEERSTNQRAQPTVATPSTRPTPSDSNPPPSRRTRPSRPTPAPSPRQPVTSHRRSLSPSYTAPPPIDDPNLDSQISLGLVDPSILLSPPPPAYDPPPPIPSSSHPNEPPPPISVPSASSTSRRTVSASSTVDSEEEEEEEQDNSGPPDPLVLAWEEDRLTGLYSLDERISRDMERRRAAEEALLASQGSASTIGAIEEEGTVEEEVPGQGEDDLNEIRQAEASRDSRRLSRALSRHASRRYGTGSRRSTLLFGSGLSQLRERRTTIEESEPSESQPPSVSHSPSPSPSPTPSPSIPVSIPLSPLPTLVEPSTQSASATPRSPRPEQSSSSLTIDDRNSPFPPPLMSPAESSAIAAEFPSPSPSQASPSLSNSPYISDYEDEVNPQAPPSKALDMAAPRILKDGMGLERGPLAKEASEEEEEEEEEEETQEQALARKVTRNGRGLAALAAERRLKMERDARDRAIGGTMIETVEEAAEGESPELQAGKLEGEVRAATTPPPQTIPIPQPAASHQPLPSPGPTPEEPRETPSARARKHSFNDAELSFSRPSSRSSFPRPAPPPQLVPLEPEPTTIASPSQRTVPSPLARPVPPPVPARRSVGRRSLDEPIPLPIAPASPSALNRTSSGRRVPPPPPPPREIGQRPSVRALAAALNGTPIFPRPSSPPTRSTATSIATTTRPDSLDSASVGSASTYPSSLSGPRPIPAPRLAQHMASNESLGGSVPRTASLPSSLEATSHLAPRRHRPLPIPPAPLSQDRIDAFTALRAVQGVLSPTSDAPSPAPVARADPVPSTSASASASAPVRPILRPRLSTSSSSSSLEHPGPPLPRRPPQAQAEQLSAYTDLDVLLARLEGEAASGAAEGTARTEEREPGEGEDGRNYDDLLTLGEIMGNVAPAGASPEEIAEHLTVAPVELERRRIDKRGKVKTKLSIVGVRCVDCSICMSRFRVDDSAVVLSNCLHIFHEKCIRSWFRRSRQCPVCRAQVFPPRPLVDLTAP